MISAKLKEQLQVLKDSSRIPGVILITGLYENFEAENGSEAEPERGFKAEKLIEAARLLEDSEVSEAKGSLVFLESEAGASIKVDDVRSLLKNLSFQNWDSSAKRYVLVPRAELLTVQSSNALLKSLEESPEGTHFILGAPSKRSVLKTVLSRAFVLSEEAEGHKEGLKFKNEQNVFYEAFFSQNSERLLKAARADLKYEWQEFSWGVKEKFISKVYSGDLDKKEWHKLFNFMDEVDQKIEANMDVKWLAASIDRFGFSG